MTARRCHGCDINWPPYDTSYVLCPSCLEETEYVNARPLEKGPAEDLARLYRERNNRRREFETYYEEREVAIMRDEMDAWLAAQLC